MGFKAMNGKFAVSAFAALTALSTMAACGGDDKEETKEDAGTGGGDDAGAKPATYDMNMTLVGVLDLQPVSASHEVELLSAETGAKLSPERKTTTAQGAGTFSFKDLSRDEGVWIHVTGYGPAGGGMSTYDSLSLGAPDSGDKLIRISTAGTATIAESTAKFTADMAKIAIGGAVYKTDATGKRIGAIGCAQVFLDDTTTLPTATDDPYSIRYVAATGLPAPLGDTAPALNKTLSGTAGGKFFIGNVSKGKHTFKVSMDGGKTFIKEAEKEIYIPFTRAEATGETKAFLVLIGLDLPAGMDPTPAGCP
jgi:hypothetical protein